MLDLLSHNNAHFEQNEYFIKLLNYGSTELLRELLIYTFILAFDENERYLSGTIF